MTQTEYEMAPWTPDQTEALNDWQRRGDVHPMTCGNEHSTMDNVLIARRDGWYCPSCAYRQNWAHKFMTEPWR